LTGTDIVHRPASGERVLVVEPCEDAAATLTAALRLHGIDARSALTASDALKLIAEAEPQVVVTDLDLPDADGCALIRRLRARPRPPAVVVVSAHTALGHRRAAASAGAVEYFLKPANPEELAELVRRLCQPTSGD
jgi:two-component system response regulator AtoC